MPSKRPKAGLRLEQGHKRNIPGQNIRSWQQGLSRQAAQLTFVIFWIGAWLLLLGGLWLLFVAYLLNQWLLD